MNTFATPAPQVVTMLDTVSATIAGIPVTTPKVGGYATGTPDIEWSLADWARFPHSGKVRIDQRAGLGIPFLSDCADTETGDKTVADTIGWIKARQAKNWASPVYISQGRLIPEFIPAVEHAQLNTSLIFLWIADWDLDEAEAAALIGTKFHDMETVAVQWASPSSNPDTPVPGGPAGATLKSANVDISAAAEWWHPAHVPSPPNWLRNATSQLEAARRQVIQAGDALNHVDGLLRQHGG